MKMLPYGNRYYEILRTSTNQPSNICFVSRVSMVGGFEDCLSFHILGMTTSRLTFMFFRRGRYTRYTTNQVSKSGHSTQLQQPGGFFDVETPRHDEAKAKKAVSLDPATPATLTPGEAEPCQELGPITRDKIRVIQCVYLVMYIT